MFVSVCLCFCVCACVCVVIQGEEEKGLCAKAGPAEAVGLVLGPGTDDISAMESCDWTARPNRTRRVTR